MIPPREEPRTMPTFSRTSWIIIRFSLSGAPLAPWKILISYKREKRMPKRAKNSAREANDVNREKTRNRKERNSWDRSTMVLLNCQNPTLENTMNEAQAESPLKSRRTPDFVSSKPRTSRA